MADKGFTPPAGQQLTPGLPTGADTIVFEGFDGLNTRASRPAIGDQEMFWCDNFMPIGRSNLRTLWDVGTALYTAPTGTTIESFFWYNLAAISYCAVFLSNGQVVQIAETDGSTTTIMPAGTLTVTATVDNVGAAQWGSQYLIIVADQTNGYWVWDGAHLFTAGTLAPQITLTSSGTNGGYTSSPTITAYGGSGTGATFSATIKSGYVTSVSVTNPGSGYLVTDTVQLGFSGGGTNMGSTAIVTCTVDTSESSSTKGEVITTGIVTGGSGYGVANPTYTLSGGGGGSGASFTIGMTGGVITTFSIKSAGSGYTEAPIITISGGGQNNAGGTTGLMPFGVQGTALEIFTSHAWVMDGNKILFTASGSVSDFGTSDGGGAFPSTDSFLRQKFVGAKQTSGFLYTIADSSVNYVSGVQSTTDTTTEDITTTFSNQNVDPQVGSPWPGSIQVYSRAVVMANPFGIHALYGGSVEKVSSPLDGIFQNAPALGSFVPSSAMATVFNINTYMLLYPITDTVTNATRNTLLMWDGKRWWTAYQSLDFTFIGTQESGSTLRAWGTDGNTLHKLFAAPSNAITKTVYSKLWDKPTYMMTKLAKRLYLLLQNNASDTVTLTINIDNETGIAGTITVVPNSVPWYNASGTLATWDNSSNKVAYWELTGIPLGDSPLDMSGKLLGLEFSSTASDFTLVSATLLFQQYELTM